MMDREETNKLFQKLETALRDLFTLTDEYRNLLAECQDEAVFGDQELLDQVKNAVNHSYSNPVRTQCMELMTELNAARKWKGLV